MTPRTKPETARLPGAPNPAVPAPPPAQPTAMRVRAMPIMVRMVPVTTGGKNRISRPTKGTSASPNRPAAITAP